MNIYALPGHKVQLETLEAGYPVQKEWAKANLDPSKVYTVVRTEVGRSRTNVYLEEFPETPINSVFFKDVAPQSYADSKKHPQWSLYNTVDWQLEMEECIKSPYYFATNFLTVDGEAFSTPLSEEEFNSQFFKAAKVLR